MAPMEQTDIFSMRGLRSAAFALLDAIGLPRLFLGKTPRILLYHGVTDEQGEGIFNYRAKFITTAAFKAHIVWLKRDFTILPLAECITRMGSNTLPPRALAVTFDDGYANNYATAYPILRDAGVPATFFITTDFVEKNTPLPVDIIEYAIGTSEKKSLTVTMGGVSHVFPLTSHHERIHADLIIRSHMKTLPESEAREFIESIVRACGRDLRSNMAASPYRPMTWEQMREMEAHGMTFAPHTRTHPILSRLSKTRAAEEIRDSKQVLAEHLAKPLSVFAYPNGGSADYTAETVNALREAGFEAALTTEPRAIRKDDSLFALPRFTMDGANDMHRARLMVSGLYGKLAALY